MGSVGKALPRIRSIEGVIWGVMRNVLTLPWIIMLINLLIIALVTILVS